MKSLEFPARIKKMRKSNYMTQAEAARRLHTTNATISHYEAAKREPDLNMLALMSIVYGTPTDYLIANPWYKLPRGENKHTLDDWYSKKANVSGFPEKLKYARKKKVGLTQMQIAEMLGIPQSTLCKYELGQLEPSIEILARITGYYRIRADWLLGLIEENEF